MFTVPVKSPGYAKLITIGAGVTSLLVAHFAPALSPLLTQVLQLLGVGAIGAGGVQIVRKP